MKSFLIRNGTSILAIILLIVLLFFHFFNTYNPPLVQPTISISPTTKDKELMDGKIAQIKAVSSGATSPENSGFDEKFITDTINKILNITNKELLAVNKINGTYRDSLIFVKEELDAQKRIVRHYHNKDAKGNITSSSKVTDGVSMVFEGNTNLIAVVKKGVRNSPDSLVFYDPDQKFRVNQSWEYKHALPVNTKRKKVTFSVQTGVGIVVPKFEIKDAAWGHYTGVGVSYNF